MDPEKTKKRAIRKHEEAVEEKKTCIDCHKGIAHKPVHLDKEDDGGGKGEKKDEKQEDKKQG